ncbi:hypothetical protein [Rubinisphaera sp.]|uniref:hypothetical protein n=1 Tax=Rubinisphaera sp. TaxID=2024857 RepID=UPI000C0F9D40|nr:hypothetical protein [Rubinisphaera sp.]MBV07742.1 hypothetical protein [Rubinisphaera sp.]HCS51071.1 hypothetical protein [Planctomycetaceae bacterium]|tara:strand:+ start:215 stop:760 length:546 start_codon:yes stop_codon:yes gene_type:complete
MSSVNSHTFRWLLIALISALAISLISVWLPAGLKKIGLFSLALGAGFAFITSLLTGTKPQDVKRWQVMILILFAGCTEAGRALESYRIYHDAAEAQLEKNLEELPAFAQEMREEITNQHSAVFVDYLLQKYSALAIGDSSTLACLIFALEIILAMGGAGGLIWIMKRQSAKTDSESARKAS